MSLFIPKKGNLFYLERKLRIIESNEDILNGVVVTLKKTIHSSNGEYVNKCLGTDGTSIVYEIVSALGSEFMLGKKYMAIINNNIFYPVGPEIKEALGLLEGSDEVVLKKETL